MWGHYTRNHYGFALEFDHTHEMFRPDVFGKVYYDLERPGIDVPDHRRILLQKAPSWAYEEEYRLYVELKKGADYDFRSKEDKEKNEKRPYLNVDFKAIKAVYFGVNIEPKQRETILSALQTDALKHIEPFQMFRHRTQFGVVSRPYRSKPNGKTVRSIGEIWAKHGY